MKTRRIVITGGHHTCALVVAQELVKRGHQVFWLGHKYSMWGDKNESAEYLEITKARIPFFELKAGKYWRTLNPVKLVRLPLGFVQAFSYLLKLKPDLIVSFGGYLAIPVVIVGWLLRIPAVTHEQTVVAGLANKLITPFVKKVFLTWPQTQKYYPSNKAIVTGLPLRKEILVKKTKKYEFRNKLPTIYITGGKQGSHEINRAVFALLDKFLDKYNLIHQCGLTSLHTDYKEAKRRQKEIRNLKLEIRNLQPGRYEPVDYIFPDEIGAVFGQADLVIGRAGAHTIYELAALGKPAILIPHPVLYGGEQIQNARLLEEVGLVKVLLQRELTGESLLSNVDRLSREVKKYKKAGEKARKLIVFAAAGKIIKEIEKLVNE